jgi:hypothetical protein
MSFKGPKELKKGASGWAQVRAFKDFPENKKASLKVPGGPKQSEKSCDDPVTRSIDGRGRVAGWKPIYNDLQKARYFSEFTRNEKSLKLIPIFEKNGIKIFQSQQGQNCPTYVVRTPEFDGSKPDWWFDLPANIWESITPVFWGNWPSNWLYPPEEINPYINGRPEDSPLPPIPGLESGAIPDSGDGPIAVSGGVELLGISLSGELTNVGIIFDLSEDLKAWWEFALVPIYNGTFELSGIELSSTAEMVPTTPVDFNGTLELSGIELSGTAEMVPTTPVDLDGTFELSGIELSGSVETVDNLPENLKAWWEFDA